MSDDNIINFPKKKRAPKSDTPPVPKDDEVLELLLRLMRMHAATPLASLALVGAFPNSNSPLTAVTPSAVNTAPQTLTGLLALQHMLLPLPYAPQAPTP